jgi:hypothetical protein
MLLLALTASVVAAEFDSCARPSAIWAGFDQVRCVFTAPAPPASRLVTLFRLSDRATGAHLATPSRSLAETSMWAAPRESPHPRHRDGIFRTIQLSITPVRLRRIGNLSFHSMHKSGDYSDHEGTSSIHDAYTDVTVHHDSETFTDPDYYKHPAMAQHGMDSVIYKISEAGVPLTVFAADTTTFDGVYDGSGVNGLYSSYSQFVALDSFGDEADTVAGVGEHQPLFNHRLQTTHLT